MFHLFLCLLVISIFSLKEVYSNPLPIFKDSCKSVDLQEFFVCSRYKSLLKYMICNCFLHCGSHLFIFLMVLLETFTIFWLIFILHFCYLFSNDLCLSCFKCLSKKSSVPLGTRCVQKQKEQILVYMMCHEPLFLWRTKTLMSVRKRSRPSLTLHNHSAWAFLYCFLW